jgi:hypothetical protein
MNALDLEPPLSSVLNCLSEEDLEAYEDICQDVDDCRNGYISERLAIAIACINSRRVILALCHHADQEREDDRWQSVGRHAANRLRELFGPPITLIT